MFRNHFKTVWRNSRKHTIFSCITIGGLGVGLTAVMLIGCYIKTELSYDQLPANRAHIYRVGFRTWQNGALSSDDPSFTAPFSVYCQAQIPGINSICRISEHHDALLSYSGKTIKSAAITYADSTFLSFFSSAVVAGDARTALDQPRSIVLTAHMANLLFGKDNAVGKMMHIDSKTGYQVTAVVEDLPFNSTLQYDALISMCTRYSDPNAYMGWNGGWQYQHFLLLKPGAGMQHLEQQFVPVLQKNYNEKYGGGDRVEAYLQPLAKLHLYYNADSGTKRTNLYIFGIVALLILCISLINYVNLSVSRAFSRFKEISMRKVMGALRWQLMKQFIGETFVVALLALAIAAVFAIILLPVYQRISGFPVPFHTADAAGMAFGMVALITGISIVTGGYVSFYLASLQPVASLKMQQPKSLKNRVGKVLMVMQFAITAALVSFVGVVQMQLRYVKSRPLGFDKEHMLVLSLTGDEVCRKAPVFKQQIAGIAGVESVSALSEVPYNNITRNGFVPEGYKDVQIIHQLDADADLLKTFRIKLVSGTYFKPGSEGQGDDYIINKALADKLGWKEPLNKIIQRDGAHRVIGVVDNFHFASMHDAIEPLIITNKPWRGLYNFLAIKYNTGNLSALVDQVNTRWTQSFESAPFDYWFLDESVNRLYQSEERFKQLFGCFSLLSILLSLAGVFGLAVLDIQKRTKEIGVRRVLGANMIAIVRLFMQHFAWFVALAAIIAIPVAWYYAHVWLQNFAYRIVLPWWIFVLSGIAVLAFTALIVSIQAGVAAISNPVKNLRYE